MLEPQTRDKYGWDSGSHKTTLTTIYDRRCHYGKESSRIYQITDPCW